MKKILALFIVVVMCLAIAAPISVSAAASDYTITIDNAVMGETYSAYKIFDVTYSGTNSSYTAPTAATDIPGTADTGNQHTAYSYTIKSGSEWFSVVTANGTTDSTTNVITANGLTFTPSASDSTLYSVEATSSFDPAVFAALLNDAKASKNAAATVIANDSTLSNTTAHTSDSLYYTTGQITLNVGQVGGTPVPAADAYKGPGYYFVDTTAGALCSLGTTENNALIREKNKLPTIEKTVSDSATGTFGAETNVSIGDLVYYKIVVTDGIGTDADIRIHDIMTPGLTLVTNSFKVLKGTTAVEATNYNIYYNTSATTTTDSTNFASGYVTATAGTYTTDSETGAPTGTLADNTCTFEVVLKAAYVATLNTGTTTTDAVTITFAAILNDAAVIADEGNPNRSHLTYSNQTSPDSEAIVYTYAGALYKFNSDAEELDGAEFTMTKPGATSDADPIPMYFKQISAGSATTPAVYEYSSLYTAETNFAASGADPVLATDTIVTPKSGAVILLGLDVGSYTLTETAAPEGYNPLAGTKTLTITAATADTKLSDDVDFTTTANETATFEHEVDDKYGDTIYWMTSSSVLGIENNAGTILPSTGGIGTTLFYVIGGILVAGAFVLLVTKRRMAAKN